MLVSFPCTRDASVRKCVCGTHIVRTVYVMCNMCVCVCVSVCGAVWHRLVQPFLSRCGSRVSK